MSDTSPRSINFKEKKVCIVGAGLVGALESIYLAKLGCQVDVYERGPDLRNVKTYQGRSINLAMSDRGFLALEKATGNKDLVNEVMQNGVKMFTRYIHHKDGTFTESAYGTDGEYILSIDRRFLNEILIEYASKMPGVNFHFDHKCITMDLRGPKVSFFATATEKEVKVNCDVLVGADGAHSQVRSQLQKRIRGFKYNQDYVDHCYKELAILPKDGKSALDHENSLHIWPRKNFMLIALPNPNHIYTVTLFMKEKGDYPSFETIQTDEEIEKFFKTEFPTAYEKMPTLLDDWHTNPMSGLMFSKCYPFNDGGKTVLVGDAAHPIIPFYGQGVNAGFEDCLKLDELLRKSTSLEEAFNQFSATRKLDVDAISDLSHLNFVEMSSTNASKFALWERSLGQYLHRWVPSLFTPLYTMVAFTPEIGYNDALEKHHKQTRVTRSLLQLGCSAIGIGISLAVERILFPGTFKRLFSSIIENLKFARVYFWENKMTVLYKYVS